MAPSRNPRHGLFVISGGQTGVDRGALDAALEAGVSCGGWCPTGRRAEDGPIPGRYPLAETETADYEERTRRNVRESDGTLIIADGPLKGGTALTMRCAEDFGKPCLVVDRGEAHPEARIWRWIRLNRLSVLNVAGPRESHCAGIGRRAQALLLSVLGRVD